VAITGIFQSKDQVLTTLVDFLFLVKSTFSMLLLYDALMTKTALFKAALASKLSEVKTVPPHIQKFSPRVPTITEAKTLPPGPYTVASAPQTASSPYIQPPLPIINPRKESLISLSSHSSSAKFVTSTHSFS
jgi:hypothetical protein